MGNRFSTLTQYHSLVIGHGVLAAITFLFIVPVAVMTARFYTGQPGFAIRYHTYLQVLAVLLSTAVLVLGWFAVGPQRSLTNPHHGIGVAIYTLILVNTIGGRLFRHIRHRPSLRIMLHKWFGRATTILGIVQVPLGMALYGCAKYLFILYSLWMSFLLLLYFILSYRRERHLDRDVLISGGRSEGGRSRVTEKKKSGGMLRWLGPLAAGVGILALLNHRDHDRERSRSRSRSRRGPPEVIPSRRGSESYIEDEKYSAAQERRGGGMMDKILGVGAALGAAGLVKSFMDRRERGRHDEEYSGYSEVATDTPSRIRGPPSRRGGPAVTDLSDETESIEQGGRRTPLRPGPGNPRRAARALSATTVSRNGPPRPVTPRPSHRDGHSRVDSYDASDYTSYRSPSRKQEDSGNGLGKGLLAGLGLGWFAKRMSDRRGRKEDERFREEEERRAGNHGSRFTGDGHPSPTRRPSGRRPPPAASEMAQSSIEERPQGSAFSGPPMPPFPAGTAPPVTPMAGAGSRSRSRHDVAEPVAMPAMPPDPRGILYRESGSELYSDGRPARRASPRRRQENEAAAAAAPSAAAASVSLLSEAEDDRRRNEHTPVSVALRVHDDRDRKITLRRVPEDEAATRRQQRRQRSDSVSSLSGTDTASGRRYRRDTSRRPAERSAERRPEEEDDLLAPLSPPNPAYAQGRRPQKDSAYYSGGPGQAGPSGSNPAAGQTVSSIVSPESHGAWSGVSPSSAADRRRRRRLERQGARPTGTVDFE